MARTFFHVTSSLNRDSIREHGLDWRRMKITHGIAGVAGIPLAPELNGIFLFDDEADISYWAYMGLEQDHSSVDAWAVTLDDDHELIVDNNGFSYTPEPIPPERVTLHTESWTQRHPSDVASTLFWSALHPSEASVAEDLLDTDAVVVELDGTRHEGRKAAVSWLRGLALHRPAIEEGLQVYGPDEVHALVYPWGRSEVWTLVSVEDNEVGAITEFSSERDARVAAGDTEDD